MDKTFSLNTPFRILQKNLWNIKKQSTQLELENKKLKGKLNSQQKWRKSHSKASMSMKNLNEESEMMSKLWELKKKKKKLKEKLTEQEEETQAIHRSIFKTDKLIRTKIKQEKKLQKYTRKLQRQKNREEKAKDRGNNEKYVEENQKELDCEKIRWFEESNDELEIESRQKDENLKSLKKVNSQLNRQILELINIKNSLRYELKKVKLKK